MTGYTLNVYVPDTTKQYFHVVCTEGGSSYNMTHTMCYYNGDLYYYDGRIYRRDDDLKCFDYVGIYNELREDDPDFPKSDSTTTKY